MKIRRFLYLLYDLDSDDILGSRVENPKISSEFRSSDKTVHCGPLDGYFVDVV